MTEKEFRELLAKNGFQEPKLFEKAPGDPIRAEHTHDFDVRGLLLGGQAQIEHSGQVVKLIPGDDYHVPAGLLHCEKPIGEELVRMLIARGPD